MLIKRLLRYLQATLRNRSLIRHQHQSCRVVVTGAGIVSPLGVGVETTWNNLLLSKCGISPLQETEYNDIPCKIAARVPREQLNLESRFNKSELKNLSLATIYALIAAEEALTQARWKPTRDRDKRMTGVAIGMGMVDLVDIMAGAELFNKRGYRGVSPHFVTKMLINMPAGHVSINHGFTGPNHSVSTACTTGAHSVGDAFNLIEKGAANVMVCGGTDAVISPLAIAAFARIRALCTDCNHRPESASRPFDVNRSGFVLGEGCGLLVLEELNHALARKAEILAEILGYGLSGDAHHITAPSEDGRGALQCMQAAIDDAHIKINEITYINAHATSTLLGDAAEINAIKQLFGDDHVKNVAISSTKGSTGHLLGASGSVEAIFTVLSCHNKIIPPSINIEEPLDKELNIVANVSQEWKNDSRKVAITNSFGFGGTNASLVISEFVL